MANAVAIQIDGKIVAAGGGPGFDWVIARYTQSGQLDPTFGSGGIYANDFSTIGITEGIHDIVLQPDGKIIAVGTAIQACAQAAGCQDFAVARHIPNGDLDLTFGVDGKVTTDFGTAGYDPLTADGAVAVALQTDGKIVVAGSSSRHNPADPDQGSARVAVARYTTSGLPDTSFNVSGKTTTILGGIALVGGAAIQNDEKIVVVGSVNGDFALVRYLASGGLDPAFGTDGKVISDFGNSEVAEAVAIQSDGKIVVVGASGGDFIVARYLTDGTLDANFGSGGATITDMGGGDAASAVKLQCDGRIVLAGESSDDFALARYFGDDPVQLASVVSRKTHAGAGDFDINLPVAATPGIECRTGGASGDYTLVFSFLNTLTSVGGASVSSGTGSVSSSDIGSDRHQYIVNLTGVTNAQVITVDLTNVNDSIGNSGCTAAQMAVLVGDTTGNGTVNSSDISQTKAQSGTVTFASNFRTDVTVNGLVNSSDISTVKSKSGTALP